MWGWELLFKYSLGAGDGVVFCGHVGSRHEANVLSVDEDLYVDYDSYY